ncbi:MAG: hypothetical protein JWM02_3524 [Frankiales bacterium]|nr:hypothetical protein [Frankiales bacterium]
MGGMTHRCGVGPEDLGPYLLDHLTADEAERVAAALAECPTCSEEVSLLRPTVAALAVAVPYQGHAPSLPAPSFDRVLGTVNQRRQATSVRRRVALAAAALVVAVALGLSTFVIGFGRQESAGQTLRLAGTSGASGRVVLDGRSWGTAISLEVRGLDPHLTYGAWLARPDGQRVSAGSFRPDAQGAAKLELGAALARSDIGSMGVTPLGGADVLSTKLTSR